MPITSLARRRANAYIGILCALFLAGALLNAAAAHASTVTIRQAPDGQYTLLRDGKPYFINGAGGVDHLAMLASLGGNSIRTWGVDQLDKQADGKPLLDRLQELNLTITAGIWVEHERHGFNYSDPAMLQKQRDTVRADVRKYKGSPALLIWGLGNEMEGPASAGDDPRIWKELNVLAGIVKQEDPSHPVMTVIAGATAPKIEGILKYYPNIDILGVNAYSGASGVGRTLKGLGWKKPFILTEFGPAGAWEVPATPWHAPIEPSSREKAGTYYATETGVVQDAKDICLGSYVFLWGHKQEATSTWYGMFLKTGEKLPTVDAIVRAWTGKWPPNRSPRIVSFTTPLREATVGAGQQVAASVVAEDPENDPLQYEWTVTAESTDRKVGGDTESEPPSFPECTASAHGSAVTIKTPTQPGAYRLFITVRDGQGGASEDNVPFLVTQ
ncbi:MAG TPA: glycoside hydrolase family 2 TIM barrel-domain containing protein [Chthoniobacteraceae bacterium]|jgi:hypothetical protein|nr:glycoside hydrolase family 2 TIM barrel-domain containing protein [Chthoniobacteraceae bacterium]